MLKFGYTLKCFAIRMPKDKEEFGNSGEPLPKT